MYLHSSALVMPPSVNLSSRAPMIILLAGKDS